MEKMLRFLSFLKKSGQELPGTEVGATARVVRTDSVKQSWILIEKKQSKP